MVDSTKDSIMIDLSASKEEQQQPAQVKLPTGDISNPDFENTLKQQSATPVPYDDLIDYLAGEAGEDSQMDADQKLEQFCKETYDLSLQCAEDWRAHFDCLEHLRSLNKYHATAFDLGAFTEFITKQMENLRSSNSRGALMLVNELYSKPKVSPDQLECFSRDALPICLKQTLSEKTFLSMQAKKAVTACTSLIGDHFSAKVLLDGLKSKSTVLQEFCIQLLDKNIVSAAPHAFFEDSQHMDVLLLQMCEVIEGKKPRMVKHANPIMIACREALQKPQLTQQLNRILAGPQLLSKLQNEESTSLTEESKTSSNAGVSEDDLDKARKELELRVDRIFKSFEAAPPKKADTSKGFRSFMKSAKQDTVTTTKKDDDPFGGSFVV